MKKLFLISFMILISASFLTAQNTLLHDTGNFTFTVVDNGTMGDDGSGSYGVITYAGNANVIYTGGIAFIKGGVAYGMSGSYDLDDLVNNTPFNGFFSDPNFDQIAEWEALYEGQPNQLVGLKSYSKNGEPAVYIRMVFPNNTGATISDFYAGLLMDWDVGAYANNNGGYDPANNLIYIYDETASPSDPNYYGCVALNVPPNSMRGYLIQNYSATNADVVTYMTNNDFSTAPTAQDHRMHIALGPYEIPAGQTLTLDFACLAGTDLADIQTNSVTVAQNGLVLPVELTSFTASLNGSKAVLNWETATEINNLGFEIERKVGESSWQMVGFKEGHGSTTETQNYAYIDDISGLASGTISYRLKQIDFGGTFEYSDEIYLGTFATSYELSQNYPNPFNPTTTISYSILNDDMVSLEVFDALGQKVATLVNEFQQSGKYFVDFDASNLTSGVYFCHLKSGNFSAVQKMMLLK